MSTNVLDVCPLCKTHLRFQWKTFTYTKWEWHKIKGYRKPKEIPQSWHDETVTREVCDVDCPCGFHSFCIRIQQVSDSEYERHQKIDMSKTKGHRSKFSKDNARYDDKGQPNRERRKRRQSPRR